MKTFNKHPGLVRNFIDSSMKERLIYLHNVCQTNLFNLFVFSHWEVSYILVHFSKISKLLHMALSLEIVQT